MGGAMSDRGDLRAVLNGDQPDVDLRELLTEQLGLDKDMAVTDAAVFGRGPAAMVHITLADGTVVRFERFGDIATPAKLSMHLVTQTGVYRPFKGPEAGAVAATVHRLA